MTKYTLDACVLCKIAYIGHLLDHCHMSGTSLAHPEMLAFYGANACVLNGHPYLWMDKEGHAGFVPPGHLKQSVRCPITNRLSSGYYAISNFF